MSQANDAGEFTACWERDAPRVLSYARRHVPGDEAQDVVSETFVQAWRRWADVPDPALPWLLTTARHTIANQRRGLRRRAALAERVARLDQVAASATDASVLAEERTEALTALAGLPEAQREALLLVAWDGLTLEQAARVLGIRAGALRVRVHRARLSLAQPAAPSPNTP